MTQDSKRTGQATAVERIREPLGTYGVDVVFVGLLIVIATVISSAVDVVSGWAAAGGVAGWIGVRLLAQSRQTLRNAVGSILGLLKPLIVRPAMSLFKQRAVIVVVVVAVVAGLGWLVARSTDNYAALGAGLAVIVAGVAGQYWWFRARRAAWRKANS